MNEKRQALSDLKNSSQTEEFQDEMDEEHLAFHVLDTKQRKAEKMYLVKKLNLKYLRMIMRNILIKMKYNLVYKHLLMKDGRKRKNVNNCVVTNKCYLKKKGRTLMKLEMCK